MSTLSEDVIQEMKSEAYTPRRSPEFWTKYEPQMLEFLKELESREDWVASGVGVPEKNLVELISYLPTNGGMPNEGIVSLMRILSALPYGESIHALLWLDVRNAPAVRAVLEYTYEQRRSVASANIMWQRLVRVSRFHVLSGLVADLTGGASIDNAAVIAETPAERKVRADREPPVMLGARRYAVMRNEETLPFLEETRNISSLNEVDELFGNRRFYLLTEDMELCRSLAPYGVGVDQYGGYVTRGPACDFDHLDYMLPFVAKQSIKPLFGDLIPFSSWASNLSRLLTRNSWDRIRRPIIEGVGNRCEICGAKESSKEIDCHEQWEYHEPIIEGRCGVQKLVGMWVMCAECHATQHLGRNAAGRDALDRLRRIGRISEREAQAYRAFVFDRWERRSKYNWILDVSSLASHEPLTVHGAWSLDVNGFLSKEGQAAVGKSYTSKTQLLGAKWMFSTNGATVQPAKPVEDGYYE